MRRIINRLRHHKSAIVMGIISMALYVCLFALFFGTMGINNWQLRHASRTLATTLLTYCVMAYVMQQVYGGFEVGRKKNKPIISSMVLSTFMVDMVTYLQLQIMNVNTNNNAYLKLFAVL